MYGIIKNIETIENVELENDLKSYDGYKVTTDQTNIFILISNRQYCCEGWGYLSSDDDLSQFMGAELKEVNLTDTGLNKINVEKLWINEGGIQFVDFVTNKGTFQLAVYNGHNGYYGHFIKVIIGDKAICEEWL